MNLKQSLFYLFIAFVSQFGNAQGLQKQTLVSQGSSHPVYVNSKCYYIIESIGQAGVINTYTANNYDLRQGFLQPVSASVISNSSIDFRALLFPNPILREVTVKFKNPVIDVLQVALRDVLGRIVFSQQFNPSQSISLNLDNLTAGSYLLQIRMRSKVFKAKIIKR